MNAKQRRKYRRANERAVHKMQAFARHIAEIWEQKNKNEERIEEIVFLVRK